MNQNRKSSMCDADDGRGKNKSSDDKLTRKNKTSLQIQSKNRGKNKMSLIMRAARIAKGKFIG